jgi:hypothetical protein
MAEKRAQAPKERLQMKKNAMGNRSEGGTVIHLETTKIEV